MHIRNLLVAAIALVYPGSVWAAANPTQPAPAVLIELFTSEGCSSCPPADTLLAQLNGQQLPGGARVIGLSEHVTYWNHLGWADPYSSEVLTARQQAYAASFHLDSVYTPQAVVSGDAQEVGSDAGALHRALLRAAQAQPVQLHVLSAAVDNRTLSLHYSAHAGSWPHPLQLFVAMADDADRSHVLRGENSGRLLGHINVVRALLPVARLDRDREQTVRITLPDAVFANPATGHLLVLWAQDGASGSIEGAEAIPLTL